MGLIFPLLILAAVVIGIIAVVRRVLYKRDEGVGDGGDVIAYLLMALALGTAGFSLASLGRAAFPGDSLVFGTEEQVAGALAGLVVATPITIFLWRRQAERRAAYPRSGGWIVYLTAIEAVFLTATVIAAFSILYWALGEGDLPNFTDFLVFGGIVVFHEWAATKTPPGPDGGELPRVVGSAIGLITGSIGMGGVIYWLLDRLYSTFTATAGEPEIAPFVALLVIGAPIWWYRWWRPWPGESGAPRQAWAVLTSVVGLSSAIGATVTLVANLLLFPFTDSNAGDHFSFLPAAVAVGIVGSAVWIQHRQRLGTERTAALRSYEYLMAAIGLGATIGGATGLAIAALGPSDLVDSRAQVVVVVITILLAGLAVWGRFWMKALAAPRETEAAATPRRFYLIGLAIVTGLIAAGALIATLVIVFQRMLDSGTAESLVIPASLFVFSGLATWHLLRVNAQDRELIVSDEVITPFEVTIVCSHPGMIATAFPKAAKLRVIYRGDDAGVITEEMVSAIVEAVGHHSSLVWVDQDGFRVAAAR